MADATGEDYGPRGDAGSHRSWGELEAGLAALAKAPEDEGRVELVVVRRADGVRETPGRAQLTPEEGIPGDRWGRMTRDYPEMQIAVMRRDVAELIANGQPLTVFGDNLFVNLDLCAANLPVGAQLRVGQARVEVTPKPHTGCFKFKGRFGSDALRLVAQLAEQNLRGIYWRVLEAGSIAPGDPIQVLSRPSPGSRP